MAYTYRVNLQSYSRDYPCREIQFRFHFNNIQAFYRCSTVISKKNERRSVKHFFHSIHLCCMHACIHVCTCMHFPLSLSLDRSIQLILISKLSACTNMYKHKTAVTSFFSTFGSFFSLEL